MAKAAASFWQVFRVIFVLFSLYLLGDAFFRWDGFSYYATFSEFLPAIALASVLWSIVAGLSALPVWLAGLLSEWLHRRIGWRLRMKHLPLFICVFAFLGALAWISKRLIWYHIPTTPQLKLVVLSCVIIASIFLTWLFRNKTDTLQERITPLVWLFGIWVIVSVPLVTYQTLNKGEQIDNVVLEKTSQSSVTDDNPPNIILVIFDTLTARDMSVYGYDRPTTPFISEWAKTASLFTRTQAGSNFTAPTTATLMTGKRVWTHQTYQISGSKPVKNHIENLPLVLKNKGYYNMAFIVNPYASVDNLGISKDFNIAYSPITFFTSTPNLQETIWALLYRLFGDKIRLYDWIVKGDFVLYKLLDAISQDFSITSTPPEKAFNKFLEIINNKPPSASFFAWIHLVPPHAPYLPPEPYMGMFDSSQGLRTFKTQDKKMSGHKFKDEDKPDIDILRARYDEYIRYCDKKFEYFIKELRKKDGLKNTVIILSADHGESFEHNYVAHAGPHLYEQLTHVPLIIKEPGQTEGRVINELTEQTDITATILDLADIPVPSWMEGRSLVPLMHGKKLPPKPAFSMNFQKNPSRSHLISKGTIAVWEGDYKLIYYLGEEKSLLFNLEDDPGELNNLFDREPEIGQRLLTLIQDNLNKANEKISRGQ